MSDTITLADLTTELVYEAGIDGKTGANARHDLDRIYALINRQYKQLRSIVTKEGEDFFRQRTDPLNIPSRESGEDYIPLPWPTDAAEIVGVDVRAAADWHELTKSSWRQRRVFAGYIHRPDSPGEWAVIGMPQPDEETVTEGAIAIWPPVLGGQYRIDYVPHWVPITDPTHVFVLFPHWEEWLLSACAMVIIQRDNNKRAAFEDARDRKMAAEAQVVAHCRRAKRGVVVARRRDGLEL